MNELKDAVNRNSDKSMIRMYVDNSLKRNYNNILQPKMFSLGDFFYPITVKVFYLDMGEKDGTVIEYLTNLLSERFLNVGNLSEGRKRFFEYYYTEQNTIGYDLYGDMALFNAGIAFAYIKRRSKKTKINNEYFRSVGKSAYYNASRYGTRNSAVFKQLSESFEFYEQGFNIISTDYIFSVPEEYITDQLIDSAENFRKSRTEDNLLSKLKHEDIYYKSLEDWTKMRALLQDESLDNNP